MNRTDDLFNALKEFEDIPYVKYIQDQILTYPGTLSFQNCILPTEKAAIVTGKQIGRAHV